MRHGDKQNNLSRTASHRKALLMNLGCQLITYKRITTTLAKAKALRTYIEPIITKTKNTSSKEAIMHNHRIVFSYLNDKAAVKELFTVVAPKIAARPGGYTRIIKLGARVGDNAEIAMIELVHLQLLNQLKKLVEVEAKQKHLLQLMKWLQQRLLKLKLHQKQRLQKLLKLIKLEMT